MLAQYRRSIEGFWRKTVIYMTVLVMFIQPGILQQLMAMEHEAKQYSRLSEEYERAVRTFIDPALPVSLQQKLLCQKQLEGCRRALRRVKAGRDAEYLIKDIGALQERLERIHLNLMTELAGVGARLLEKGASREVLDLHEEFCRAVEERYREFDRRLTVVRRGKGRRDLEAGLKRVLDFLKPRPKDQRRSDSVESSEMPLPHHAAAFNACRPHRPPFFQWPWLLAAGDEVWCSLLADMLKVDSAIGQPDANDLLCNTDDINFDPNNENDPITAKAAELDNNPVKIFEFVRNEPVYEPYFGSIKGARRTLQEGAGNDMDLASALMALLRASGIPCRYVCGTIEITVQEAAAWIGINDPSKAVELFQKNGICVQQVDYAGGEPATIQLDHVWVKAYIDNFPYRGALRRQDYEGLGDGDAWIDLDPSFKQHTFTATKDIEQSTGVQFDPDTLLANACYYATVGEDEKYVFGIDEDLIVEQLLVVAEPIRDYLAGKNLTTETIFRQRQVSEERYGILPVTDHYRIVDRAVNFSNLPDVLRHQLTITLKNSDNTAAFSVTRTLPELAGKAITLMYEPADDEHGDNLTDPNAHGQGYPDLILLPSVLLRPRLRIGEDVVPEQSEDSPPVGMGRTQKLQMVFTAPDGSTEQIDHQIAAGGMHSLVLDPQRITGDDLSQQYAVVDGIAKELDANEPLMPDDSIGGVLHGVGLSYLHQLDRFNQIGAGCLGLAVTRQPSIVRVGWGLDIIDTYGEPNLPLTAATAGVRVAVGRDVHTAVGIDKQESGTFSPEDQFLFTSALTASALKYNTLTQALPGKKAVSVASVIRTANSSSEPNIPIYTVTDINEANDLTQPGGALADLPEDIRQGIRDAVRAGCEVTVPKTAVAVSSIGDCNYVGYVKRNVHTSASEFVLYNVEHGSVTASEHRDDLITPIELLLESDSSCDRYDELKTVAGSAAGWLKVAEGATTNTGLSYLPAMVDINRWFETRMELDPVTTVASILAVISPITFLSEQAGIFNVQAGAGCNGQIGVTCSDQQVAQNDWVGIDANEFIIHADVTHDANWQAAIYKYGQSEMHSDPCSGTGPKLEAVFRFQEPNDGHYRYELTAGSDANAAMPVKGSFWVDLTEPNANITEVNTPGPNGVGALVVEGTAWDEYFTHFQVFINQDGNAVRVKESTVPVSQEGVLCTIGTTDFNDGDANVILKVWDIAGNVSTDTSPATIKNPDLEPPVVSFHAFWDGNEIGPETLVDGIIEVNLAPVDANEQIKKIELYWCDQDGQTCELVTVKEDPNGVPIDVNSQNPWIYQVSSYLFENGGSQLVAYTWDMFGNVSPNSINFFNYSTISGFRVEPSVVTPPKYKITVYASLRGSPAWDVNIYDPCDNLKDSDSGVGGSVESEFVVSSWDDGTYTANLVVGAHEANTPFVIALDPPIAEISNLDDDADLDETERGPLPIVADGLFDLMGAAYHSAASQVQYKIELFRPTVTKYYKWSWQNVVNDPNYFVKCITPGEPDSQGWSLTLVPPTGSLGTLDFTGVENGTYQMLLTVRYEGSESYDHVGFVLDSPLKVGNVKFSQEDLVVDTAGMPLRVVRTYDSFKKDIDGELGYGWSYTIADMDIKLEEEREDMYSWLDWEDHSVRISPNYDRNVTLTLPDGTRTTFVFYLKPIPNPYTGGYDVGLDYYKAMYFSPPGVTATLETLEEEIMNPAGFWSDVWGMTGATAYPEFYDFSGYVLTTEDDTKYYIERKSYGSAYGYDEVSYGLTTATAKPYGPPRLSYIRTPSGEQIDLNVNLETGKISATSGIQHYDAGGQLTKSIQFAYDANDRIVGIWAPSEDKDTDPCSIKYVYDGGGDLIEVHRLIDKDAAEYETTKYFYDGNHFITDINDPRGLKPIQYIYDEDGKLIQVKDAKGNTIDISHSVLAQRTTVYDRYDNATTYVYNERGNVVVIEHPDGYTTTYEYTDLPRGTPGTPYYYPGNPDRPTAITDKLGNKTYYEYDEEGRAGRITDPEGNVTENYYDQDGNLTLTIQLIPDPEDPNGLIELSRSSNVYDWRGRLEQSIDALGHVTEYVYDDSTNNLLKTITEVTDQNSGELVDVITTYTYGDANAPSSPNSITDPAGFTRYFAYDKNGNQIRSWYEWEDPNDANNTGKVVTRTEYDAMGRAVKTLREVTDANGSVSEYSVTLSETRYNSIGQQDVTINQHGVLTKYEYDHLGNVVEVKTYDSNDTYTTDPDNYLTISQTLYDKEGRAIVTVDAHDPCATSVNGTETVYDALGRAIETRRWADVVVPIEDINVGGTIVGRTNTLKTNGDPNWSRGALLSKTVTQYLAGRVEWTKVQDESGQFQITYCEYDRAGRQTAVIDPLDNRTEYEYEGNRRVLMRDARGHETQFVHDALGRVITTVYHDGNYTYTDYDELGRQVAQIDQAGRIRWFEYDQAGRLRVVVLPDVNDPYNNNERTSPRYEYEYDDYGNLTAIWDNIKEDPDTGDVNDIDARVTEFTYNEIHQQLTRTLPGGQTECKEYDANGLLIKAADFEGHVVAFTYDDPNARGQVHYQTFYDSNDLWDIDDPNLEFHFEYDKLGRKKAVDVNDEGSECSYTYHYDAEGRVEYLWTPQGYVAYEYHDITGRRMSVRTPKENADTKVRYYYDQLGRLAEVLTDLRNGQNVDESAYYTYNKVGSLESVLYPNGNYAYYQYDALNRLTKLTSFSEFEPTPATPTADILSSYEYTLAPDGQRTKATETAEGQQTIVEWQYDALNRLVAEDYNAPGDTNDFEHQYEYDMVGNRLERYVISGDGNDTSYYYNDNDQLTSEVTDGNTITYDYDENGALIKKDAGSDPNHYYTYNLRGRLAKLQIEGGSTVDYTYNPDGIRVQASVAGGSTKYLIDPYNHTGFAQVFKEVGDSNTVYIYGHDVIAQAAGQSEPDYLLYDGHGSVRQLSNNVGNIVARYAYDAYGKAHTFNPADAATKLLYCGEMYDSHLAHYYLRARWYNPATGRFNRMDPFAGNNRDPQSLHKYLYAHCNPIGNIDPSGRGFFNLVSLSIGLAISLTVAMINATILIGVLRVAKPAIEELRRLSTELRRISPLAANILDARIRRFIAHLKCNLYESLIMAGIAWIPVVRYFNIFMLGGRLVRSWATLVYSLTCLREGLTFANTTTGVFLTSGVFMRFQGRLSFSWRVTKTFVVMPRKLSQHIRILREALAHWNVGNRRQARATFYEFGRAIAWWGDFECDLGKRWFGGGPGAGFTAEVMIGFRCGYNKPFVTVERGDASFWL